MGIDYDSKACWAIKTANSEANYRAAVAKLFSLNDDATLPEHGWPWPWKGSNSIDYAYTFVDGRCKVFSADKGTEWPNMTNRQNVTLGRCSGLMFVVTD